jgi:hypothetical protein
MQLNNWLQGHGGTKRLAWESHRGGSCHRPTWHSECFGTVTSFNVAIFGLITYLATVDGKLLGKGQGSSKGGAQEAAAGMTLANLLSSPEAATPC